MPHHSAPRPGSVCPHSGIAPWARREGPSLAQRGYPGIHAGMSTAQCLRSASVVNGASKIKVQSKIKIKIKIKGKSGVRADPSLK
ncbi:nucleoid-structuring protein H-NS [Pseudomonas sp. H2_D02]